MPDRVVEWTDLFGGPLSGPAGPESREFLVFKKAGQPLLVVPRGVSAQAALSLYPAQTALARLARFVWGQALRLGLAGGAERVWVRLDSTRRFLQFLQAQAADATRHSLAAKPKRLEPGAPRRRSLEPAASVPFALLAGNPLSPGRRFLLLLLDAKGAPLVVVKAGADAAAATLIAHEADFLESRCLQVQGLPRFLGEFEDPPLRAFAMEFIQGESPGPGQAPGVVALLQAWLKSGVRCTMAEIPAWKRLAAAGRGGALFATLETRLASLKVQAPLFHGDLAPWNLKVSTLDGSWTALDWERGERSGPPAWDWFHYLLQPAILVRRESAAALAETAHEFLASNAFGDYAQAAGIVGHEAELLLAYLLHCRDVLRPAEGSPRISELLSLLAPQWVRS
jgi:hypothetical protein